MTSDDSGERLFMVYVRSKSGKGYIFNTSAASAQEAAEDALSVGVKGDTAYKVVSCLRTGDVREPFIPMTKE